MDGLGTLLNATLNGAFGNRSASDAVRRYRLARFESQRGTNLLALFCDSLPLKRGAYAFDLDYVRQTNDDNLSCAAIMAYAHDACDYRSYDLMCELLSDAVAQSASLHKVHQIPVEVA